jgi:hypothetical protein
VDGPGRHSRKRPGKLRKVGALPDVIARRRGIIFPCDFKKTDCPAFRASGPNSVKEFERLYTPVLCQSLNSANVLACASVSHPKHAGIALSTAFNPGLPPDIIGKNLLRFVEAAKNAG